MAQTTKTPKMVLQELTVKMGYAPPVFDLVFQKSGTHENRFDFTVSVANIEALGSGPSKQIGKQQAAHNALQKLQEMGVYKPSENPVTTFFKVPFDNDDGAFKPALNCIAELQNICLENKIPAPEFIEISSVGPPHNKEFAYECKISSITTEAKSSTKKMAKQLAAQEMLERIKDTLPDLIYEHKTVSKELMEKESDAIAAYQEFREIIPDKSVKIDELPNTLAKLMSFKDLKFEDFQEDLQRPSEETLKKILEKLEVKYILQEFQEQPPIAVLTITIDTPFTIMAYGPTFEAAKQEVLFQTFIVLEAFMQIKL